MRNTIALNIESLSFSQSLKQAVKNMYKKGHFISINKCTLIEKGYVTTEIWLRPLKKHNLINQPSGIKIQLGWQTERKINKNSLRHILYLKSFPDTCITSSDPSFISLDKVWWRGPVGSVVLSCSSLLLLSSSSLNFKRQSLLLSVSLVWSRWTTSVCVL